MSINVPTTPAPLTARFRSLTVLPGALIVTSDVLMPPPPARQSIVTDLVMITLTNSPASTHETMPPSVNLPNATKKFLQAVAKVVQSWSSFPALDTYHQLIFAFHCYVHGRVKVAAAPMSMKGQRR